MKNKVLKLAKRLGKFAVDEIGPLLMITKDNLMPVLGELVAEKKLIKREDGLYFYNEETILKPKLPLFFEFRTKEELELIKKCFCADLTCVKTGLILNLSDNTICKFYTYFRKIIFETQLNILNNYYKKVPQTPRIRIFFNIPIYFYYYKKRVFVSDKIIKSENLEQHLSDEEDKEFRKTYLKLTRKITHNTMKNNLTYHIAEQIWRMDKSFDNLIEEKLFKLLIY